MASLSKFRYYPVDAPSEPNNKVNREGLALGG